MHSFWDKILRWIIGIYMGLECQLLLTTMPENDIILFVTSEKSFIQLMYTVCLRCWLAKEDRWGSVVECVPRVT